MTSTRKDYGSDLVGLGERQSRGSITIDAYGLCQAQIVYAIDASPSNIASVISLVSQGVAYPDSVGFSMTSYKYAISSSDGGVAMLSIDYMGIARESGVTDAQITGVSTTTAQPIETHPNFTLVTDDTIGKTSPTQILAGKPASPSTNPNRPIFVPSADFMAPWRFDGFGLAASGERNIKAGIRQFLRPMYTVRGVIFFDPAAAAGGKVAIMTNGVGRTLEGTGDMDKLITPSAILGALGPEFCLLTAANGECIGTPSNFAGIKVVYDIMIGGGLGWDKDIYGPMEASIF